jgi:hypothetical protein
MENVFFCSSALFSNKSSNMNTVNKNNFPKIVSIYVKKPHWIGELKKIKIGK